VWNNFRPVYENEKENCRILRNKEIYAIVKKKLHHNRYSKVSYITLVLVCTEDGKK
jgi:hypothetical protein